MDAHQEFQQDENERSPSLEEYQRGWYYPRDVRQMNETSKMQKKLIKRLTEKNIVNPKPPQNFLRSKYKNLVLKQSQMLEKHEDVTYQHSQSLE